MSTFINSFWKIHPSLWSFDTILDTPSNNAFLIRRVSDNVEQTFTGAEITNGTYATFISGTQGAIKEWYQSDYKLVQTTNAYQFFLVENAGNPYVDDTAQSSSMRASSIVSKMSNDWIITAIFNNELNGNNGRLNFAIMGNILYENFNLILVPYGNGHVKTNTNISNPSSNYSFPYSLDGNFNLYTFAMIGGVFNIYKNNVSLAVGAVVYSIVNFDYNVLNRVLIGNRGDNANGKINKYQHLGMKYGTDLSTFDLSTHNTAIMTKYSI